MGFSAISAFFDQSVPIGIVFIVVYLVRMGRDIKHIQKDLSNHITDTNQRISQLSERLDRLYEWLIQDKAKKQ